MKSFTYSSITKIIYRYANIPVTILLTGYIIISIIALKFSALSLITLFINFVLIYTINKYYFRSYKHTPFLIQANNEKLLCSDYAFTKKVIEIKIKDIDTIHGWIFSGFANKPLLIHDANQDLTISVYSHLRGYREFLKILFDNINDDLHGQVLKKLETMQIKPIEKS